MKTNLNLSTSNYINFGQKIPTKNALALASNRFCYMGHVPDNINTITKLASDKNWQNSLNKLGFPYVFENIANMLREKYPSLNSFVLRIIDKQFNSPIEFEYNFFEVLKDAEKKLGKQFDIDSNDVDKVLEKFNS